MDVPHRKAIDGAGDGVMPVWWRHLRRRRRIGISQLSTESAWPPMLMRPKNVDIYCQRFMVGMAGRTSPCSMEHVVSNTFLVAAASGALQKTRRQTSMPTMENSVIAAAAEATRRCRIWHMRVARALDAH